MARAEPTGSLWVSSSRIRALRPQQKHCLAACPQVGQVAPGWGALWVAWLIHWPHFLNKCLTGHQKSIFVVEEEELDERAGVAAGSRLELGSSSAPPSRAREGQQQRTRKTKMSNKPPDHEKMAVLLRTLLIACLSAQLQACFAHALAWDEAAQRNTLLDVPQEKVLPLDFMLPEAGSESEPSGAPPGLPPSLPGEALSSLGHREQEGHPRSLEAEEEEEEEEGCRDDFPPPSAHQIASAMMALAVDLLRELEAEESRANTVFSPLSIGLALAHLALGAANQTEKHLLEALHLESVPCLHWALRGISQHLHRTALSVAGRLYLEKGFPIKEKFLEDSERFYGGKPAMLSGNSEADLVAINHWVKEATHGQIPTMLTDLPPPVAMVLLNAVHFRGFWKVKFDPLLTERSLFHLDEELAVPVEMMKEQWYPLSWFTAEPLDTQIARFPFKGNTTFVAIVPNHYERNFSQLLSEVVRLNLRTSFPKERPTMVKLPKLHLQDHLNLHQALLRLGLGELFSSPDFRPIAEGPLFVSSIQHQAALELEESGVEASAATSVVMSRSRSEFHLNRPFLFMIVEDLTGIPLFLGSVRNPSPGAPQQKSQGNCAPVFCTPDPGKP